MQENEPEQFHQDLWKSQEEEPMQINSGEVCARARRYERENILVYWTAWSVTLVLLAMFLYNLTRLRQPLIIAGTALGVAAFCSIAWGVVRNGPHRIVQGEPCMSYLRREFDAKRRTVLWVRAWVLLLIPAVLLSWWGGGPVLRVRTLGVQSGGILRLLAGPAPLIAVVLMIAFIWFAFTKEARRFEREIRKLDAESGSR